MSWQTVPICDDCWSVEEPGRVPVRIREPEPEHCYRCVSFTSSGIFVRRDVGVVS